MGPLKKALRHQRSRRLNETKINTRDRLKERLRELEVIRLNGHITVVYS